MAAPAAAPFLKSINAGDGGAALQGGGVKWFEIQENTFRRWVNDELKKRGMAVQSMKDDWKDGLMLVNLMEIISAKSLGRYNKHPKIISQKMENLTIAINFIKSEGIKLVNVGAEDINSGNLRIILGLIWTLILRYEIKSAGEEKSATDDLLKWVQSKIPEYNITGWTKDWNDGRAVCALVEAVRPGHFPDHRALKPENALDNARRGIARAQDIGVDPLILPEEMVHPKVDRLAVMTYIAQFRNLPEKYSDARRVRAYGPGLVEGIVAQQTGFTVERPPEIEGKIDIAVSGPAGPLPVQVVEARPGVFQASYTPGAAGNLDISITLNGDHVPGSVFHPHVLASESLGGEGKIRVFYSTTSGTQKGRDAFFGLQRLFEMKKVHLRPDFEPWIPVDVMEKDDREAVFRKASTRTLPIVFIDDVYVGDYDKVMELNENGQLDRLLQMNKFQGHLISEQEHLERLKHMPSEGKK